MQSKPRKVPRRKARLVTPTQPAKIHERVRAPVHLTSRELSRIEIAGLISRRTVQRWAAGEVLRETTELRIKQTLKMLRIVPRPKAAPEKAA
jgi:hypothetical protein